MSTRWVRAFLCLPFVTLASGCMWISRVSVDMNGGDTSQGAAPTSSISADGRFVAFESPSDDIVTGDTNDATDVFVRDVWSGSTIRASVDTDEEQYSVDSLEPSMSDDGRFVAFLSESYANGVNRIFVRDLVAGTTVDATLDPDGGAPDADSHFPVISGDGRYVAFMTEAADLVGTPGIVRYDRLTGTAALVPTPPSPGVPSQLGLPGLAINADGRYVAFPFPVEDGTLQVFVRDMQAEATELVSANEEGVPGNHMSHSPTMSSDGRYVAFTSDASDLVAGDDGYAEDVYVRDRVAGTTERASVDVSGGNPNDRSQGPPRLSGDGRYVAFRTFATDLIPNANTWDSVVVRDLVTNTTMIGGSTILGQPVGSYGPDLSGDGTYLSFASSERLAPNQQRRLGNVFVKTLIGPRVSAVSPTSIVRGSTETFTLFGERFVAGTLVHAGTESDGVMHVLVESVDVISSTELRVVISIDASAPTEPLYLVVTVPGPGGGGIWPGNTTLAPVTPMIL